MLELHESTTGLVRPQNALGTRPAVWRYTGVPGVRSSQDTLSKLQESEEGAAGVFGGQPVLHQAICLLCRASLRHGDIKDVAKELKLDWHTVKELDKQYMKAQLSHAGKPSGRLSALTRYGFAKVTLTGLW